MTQTQSNNFKWQYLMSIASCIVCVLIFGLSGCTGATGATGPMGPSGASLTPTPVPTPTLAPTIGGTTNLQAVNLTGATVNVSIDGIAQTPIAADSSPCSGGTYASFPVALGGHQVVLSMSSTDASNWGFVNVSYYPAGTNTSGFYLFGPVFTSTNTVTLNLNVLNTLVSHGFDVVCYNEQVTNQYHSYVPVY